MAAAFAAVEGACSCWTTWLRPDPLHGPNAAAFKSIRARLADSDVRAKLTICRVSQRPGHDDARAFHDALIAAAAGACCCGGLGLAPRAHGPRRRMPVRCSICCTPGCLDRGAAQPAFSSTIPRRLYGFGKDCHHERSPKTLERIPHRRHRSRRDADDRGAAGQLCRIARFREEMHQDFRRAWRRDRACAPSC